MSEEKGIRYLKREANPNKVRPKRCASLEPVSRREPSACLPGPCLGYTCARRKRIPTDPCWTFSLGKKCHTCNRFLLVLSFLLIDSLLSLARAIRARQLLLKQN